MAMGVITWSRVRDTAVDFSHPYFIVNKGFITRKPPNVPKFMSIMWPYKNNAWAGFTASLLVFNLAAWIVSRVYKKEFSPSFNLGKLNLQICQLSVVKGNQYLAGGHLIPFDRLINFPHHNLLNS